MFKIGDFSKLARVQMEGVEARLKLIEMEENMSNFDAIVKSVDPMWVASAGTTVSNDENLGPDFDRLFGAVFG